MSITSDKGQDSGAWSDRSTSQDQISKSPSTDNDVVEDVIVENPFDSESSRILFDAIDQLQSCDAGRDIDIPQVGSFGSYR
jgi:hypothetical protein